MLKAGSWTLRQTSPEDRDGIARSGQESSIQRAIPWFPSPFPDHYADGWIEYAQKSWREGQHWVFSVVDGDGAYVGGAALTRLESPGAFELSYWILPEHRARGAASAAARAVCDWAKADLGAIEVHAKTLAGNSASQHVLARAGFELCGEDAVFRYFARR